MQNRKGFTLIELLIVVVIIGILAAIALPKFGQTREQAYYTTMKSDLANLRSAQEMYYQTTGNFNYANNLTQQGMDFSESNGVTIGITEADQDGWAATATHAALATGGCAIYYGDVATMPTPPDGSALGTDQAGRPVCDRDQ